MNKRPPPPPPSYRLIALDAGAAPSFLSSIRATSPAVPLGEGTAGQAAVGVAWTGMGWLAGLCVAAGRGPALDLACVCAPAQGLQLVGVQVAGVWPCLPTGGCAVSFGRLGFGAGLGMRDRRGMDAGCERGAGCLRAVSGLSEFRASGYVVRSGSPALDWAKQNPPQCMEVASGGCQLLVFASSSPRELPHVAFSHS